MVALDIYFRGGSSGGFTRMSGWRGYAHPTARRIDLGMMTRYFSLEISACRETLANLAQRGASIAGRIGLTLLISVAPARLPLVYLLVLGDIVES